MATTTCIYFSPPIGVHRVVTQQVMGSSPRHKNMMGYSSSGVKVESKIDGLLANVGYTI